MAVAGALASSVPRCGVHFLVLQHMACEFNSGESAASFMLPSRQGCSGRAPGSRRVRFLMQGQGDPPCPTSLCSAPLASQGGHTKRMPSAASATACCHRNLLVHSQHSTAGAGVPLTFLQAGQVRVKN